jgi:hypothetical protein
MGMFVTSAFLVSDTCFLVPAALRGGAMASAQAAPTGEIDRFTDVIDRHGGAMQKAGRSGIDDRGGWGTAALARGSCSGVGVGAGLTS